MLAGWHYYMDRIFISLMFMYFKMYAAICFVMVFITWLVK